MSTIIEGFTRKLRQNRSFLTIYDDDINRQRIDFYMSILPDDIRERIAIHSGGLVATRPFEYAGVTDLNIFVPYEGSPLGSDTPICLLRQDLHDNAFHFHETTYGALHGENFSIYSTPTGESDQYGSAKLRLREALNLLGTEESTKLGSSANPTVKVSLSDGTEIFVKSCIDPARGEREALMLSQIKSCSLELPVPTIYLYDNLPIGVVVTYWENGYKQSAVEMDNFNDIQKRTVLINTLKAILDLHLAGFTHGEINWNQVLVNEDLQVLLVDLETSHSHLSMGNEHYLDLNAFFTVMVPELLGLESNTLSLPVAFAMLYGITQHMNSIRHQLEKLDVRSSKLLGTPKKADVITAYRSLIEMINTIATIPEIRQTYSCYKSRGLTR